MRCTTPEATRVSLGEPEWIEELTAEIVSSLEDCLEWKGGEPSQMMEGPGLTDIQPPWRKTPRSRRRATSAERGLAKVREAHQKALATMAELEDEVEQLSQSITWGQSEAHTNSRSWNCHRWKSWGWNRRHCLIQLEESPAPYFKYNPPWRNPASEEDEEALLDFNMEALPELGLEVNCFLQGLAKSLGERG